MKQLNEDMLFAEDIPNTDISEGDDEKNVETPDTEAEEVTVENEDTVVPDSDSEDTDEKDTPEETIKALKEEIDTLRAQIDRLEEFKRTQDRILNELSDFAALFPEIAVEEIPEEVWEAVKNGTTLTASYALYEKRKAAEAIRVANINAKNASRSPGAAGTDTAGEYFSPDDVRRMSRAEVHANYSKIRESMKKWM